MVINQTPISETPYLAITGDILAETGCGLLCHKGLDLVKPRDLRLSSASAEMALPILVRLLRVTLSAYPPARDCNTVARRERDAVTKALAALEPVQWLPSS